MKPLKRVALVFLGLLVVAGAGLWIIARHGFSARDEPWAIEALLARNLRRLASPAGARSLANPVASDPATLSEARHHFADHCASCHGNDGRGKVTLGQNLYPKAPDMTEPTTQNLSDGEIYYIIQNGIRFTGMPAWGDAHEEDRETWGLVHFIRQLPGLSAEDLIAMEALNPKSPSEWEEEEAKRRFLRGEDESESPSPQPAAAPHQH